MKVKTTFDKLLDFVNEDIKNYNEFNTPVTLRRGVLRSQNKIVTDISLEKHVLSVVFQ